MYVHIRYIYIRYVCTYKIIVQKQVGLLIILVEVAITLKVDFYISPQAVLTHLSSQSLLLSAEMDFRDFSLYFTTVASNISGRQVLYKAAKTPIYTSACSLILMIHPGGLDMLLQFF